MKRKIKLTALGQVGYIIDWMDTRLVIDPYLSDFVEIKYGSNFKRINPISINPKSISNVDYILISHEHEDHCDPISLKQLYKSNKNVKIICPSQCNSIIEEIPFTEVKNPKVLEQIMVGNISLKIVPSCHPKLDMNKGFSRFIGFVLEVDNYVIYHSGDTIPFEEAQEYLPETIDLAFLPINERNYFRDSNGIIGNMTCREALQWSKHLNIQHWIPTHWDTFKGNCTYKEELDILSTKMNIENYTWIHEGSSLEITY